jgi:hypothetical protein
MAFFQNSVVNKYLQAQESETIKAAYHRYSTYFHNKEIQQNIIAAKEEQFQEGFLRELFVNILGYTLNPNPNYNLTTELKNQKGAKKADGAILQNGSALAVIELKGADTTDLDKVNAQAFNYKNNQANCVYVITSNFVKLRFFIHNAVDYLEFNLFSLTEEEFKTLWLCLSAANIFKSIPLKIKEESILVEEKITNILYDDYAAFKKELWQNLVTVNPQFDKLLLYKKTQKLLDRILFILFSEDKGLLPPNSIVKILDQWEKLRELDEYRPLYERFLKYFNYLDKGYKARDYEIFAYNGGLFLADEILDNVKIDDQVLFRHMTKLTKYDFGSEIDVNILGHIFEHSLTETEIVAAQLEGIEIAKSNTKRKKDGVFYTPKYITKYIVENTVGKLCNTKKKELGIVDEEYAKGRKNRKKETIKQLAEKLTAYREWLLQITICDPAVGSGAFLNQALEYLIAEHTYIDELNAQLFGASIIFRDVANHILEKNLFGVDINEESIEIAKLSLWLRTAQQGRKLSSLSSNIKCGNSLIDNPNVASDKAFDWHSEFPDVFAKGGFDAVIGNPPYLRVQGLRGNFEKETKYYEKEYKSATGRFDIYVLFIEKAFSLIKGNGQVAFILPHKFMVSDFGEGIRQFLLEKQAIDFILHFGSEMVFEEASTYTCIIGLSNGNKVIRFKQIKPSAILFNIQFQETDYSSFSSSKWSFQEGSSISIFKKLKLQPLTLKDVFEAIRVGVDSGVDDLFMLKGKVEGGVFIGYSEKAKKEVILEANLVKPFLKGEDIKKYAPLLASNYIVYPHYEKEGKTYPYTEEEMQSKYPLTYNYFLPYKQELINKKIHKKTNPKFWFSLHRSREVSLFEQDKIITPEISLGTNMTLDTNKLYHNTKCYSLVKKENQEEDYRYLLAILNSSLMWFFLNSTGYVLRGGFFTFKTKYLEPFPIPKISSIEQQQPFIERVQAIISYNSEFYQIQEQFLELIQAKFSIKKISNKLQKWYLLEINHFLAELAKAKINLSLSDEAKWMSHFKEQKRQALRLKSLIDRLNKEIDHLVYQLYGLTEEEVQIIEKDSVKEYESVLEE